MGRGEEPERSHMYTGLHGKRGGAKEGSHVHMVYMERWEGPKRGHMHTGLHGKMGGAKEGSGWPVNQAWPLMWVGVE